ncbi:hypothetical protein ACSXAY_10255 [Clostridium perfringens]
MNKEKITKTFEPDRNPVKHVGREWTTQEHVIVEILEVLSKHEVLVGDVDILFDCVKRILGRVVKIQITDEALNNLY